MAKNNFKAAMQKKLEAESSAKQQGGSHPDRELMLPQENLDQKELQVTRQEEAPAGQIIRVLIDEVYATTQVRPEEDFETETLEGMKQTYDEVGLLTPPRCFPRDKKGYRLWMGESRWRSAKLHSDSHIDIYVGAPPKNDKVRILGQMIENLQQSGLKPLATAFGLQELRDNHGMTQEAMATALGKPKAFISKHMRLIDAPVVITSLLKDRITKDVDLAYTLCQIHEINQDSVEKLAKLARDGKLTRGIAIKELSVLKGKPAKEQQKQPAQIETQANPTSKEKSVSPTSAKIPTTPFIKGAVTTSLPAGDKTEYSENMATGLLQCGDECLLAETPLAATKKVSHAKLARVLVSFEEGEGYLLTDRIPEEFGQVWVELQMGTLCLDAKDITIMGIKEV